MKQEGRKKSRLRRPGENLRTEVCEMIICRDCGKRNLGHEYCEKCGSDLYSKNRRSERPSGRLLDGSLILK